MIPVQVSALVYARLLTKLCASCAASQVEVRRRPDRHGRRRAAAITSSAMMSIAIVFVPGAIIAAAASCPPHGLHPLALVKRVGCVWAEPSGKRVG